MPTEEPVDPAEQYNRFFDAVETASKKLRVFRTYNSRSEEAVAALHAAEDALGAADEARKGAPIDPDLYREDTHFLLSRWTRVGFELINHIVQLRMVDDVRGEIRDTAAQALVYESLPQPQATVPRGSFDAGAHSRAALEDRQGQDSCLAQLTAFADALGIADAEGWVKDICPTGAFVNLRNQSLDFLPEGLRIPGFIDFGESTVQRWPNTLTVGGSLLLSHSNITTIPSGWKFGGDLDISYTEVETLPAGLHIKGNLLARGSRLTTLPPGVVVEGFVQLADESA